MTLAALTASITTIVAAGNFQLAIYASSSGRPGALIAATASGSTGATGLVSPALTASKQVGPGGADGGPNLWFCSNRDNATVVFTPLNIVTPGSSLESSMIGSTNASNLISTTAISVGVSCSGGNCNGGSSTF